MKKLMTVLIFAAMIVSPIAFAEAMAKSNSIGKMDDMVKKDMMKMYQCPMDGYTSDKPGMCAKCGMKLEEKEMTSDEAKAAMEKQKSEKE